MNDEFCLEDSRPYTSEENVEALEIMKLVDPLSYFDDAGTITSTVLRCEMSCFVFSIPLKKYLAAK